MSKQISVCYICKKSDLIYYYDKITGYLPTFSLHVYVLSIYCLQIYIILFFKIKSIKTIKICDICI